MVKGQALIVVKTNLRRRLSGSSGSVIKIKCTLQYVHDKIVARLRSAGDASMKFIQSACYIKFIQSLCARSYKKCMFEKCAAL